MPCPCQSAALPQKPQASKGRGEGGKNTTRYPAPAFHGQHQLGITRRIVNIYIYISLPWRAYLKLAYTAFAIAPQHKTKRETFIQNRQSQTEANAKCCPFKFDKNRHLVLRRIAQTSTLPHLPPPDAHPDAFKAVKFSSKRVNPTPKKIRENAVYEQNQNLVLRCLPYHPGDNMTPPPPPRSSQVSRLFRQQRSENANAEKCLNIWQHLDMIISAPPFPSSVAPPAWFWINIGSGNLSQGV